MNSRKNKPITLQLANELLRKGDYEKALSMYLELQSFMPEIAHLINVNINRIKYKYKPASNIKHAAQQTSREINYHSYKTTKTYKWITSETENLELHPLDDVADILVSIIMPARNSEAFIAASINSLQQQSHKNLEIIVVDDFSSDETGRIVNALASKDHRIRYLRVNSNLGTYFCRSYGVSVANGSFITFQDADDFSHERRIEIHLHEAVKNDVRVVTSNYVRFDPKTGELIKFHGKIQHYGFITTFASKSVFSEIGTFDLTSRGGDAEFSARISKYIKKSEILHIGCPTYLASDMPGSLSYGEVYRESENQNTALSFPRMRYVKNFQAVNQSFAKTKCAELFRFPMLRSPYRLPKLMGAANIKPHRIIGCVCTIPERKEIFEKVFHSIEQQVDILYVYPDNYKDNIPDYILSSPKVKILLPIDYPGLRDGAKFLPLQLGLLNDNLEQSIILTFDDDILYPPDYAHTLYQKLSEIDFKGIVGVHGAVLNEKFKNFRTDRKVFHFKKSLQDDTLVDVLGTGTVAFNAALLWGRFRPEDVNPGLIDISLAVVCRRNFIPMHCISRHANWLQDLTPAEDQSSLWNELVQDSTPHTTELDKIGNAMWGQSAISNFFDERSITLSSDTNKYSTTFSIDKEHNQACSVLISMAKKSIFRISVKINSDSTVFGSLALCNSINGKIIYNRAPSDNQVVFLCNASINRHVSIDFQNIELNSIAVDIKIDEIFDAAPPKNPEYSDVSITACLATYPPREDCLSDVISAVLPQVDNFCLYLNRYSSPPLALIDAMKDDDKESGLDFIIDYSGKPKASGKFRWIMQEGYIFTLDDDICYPDNYFSHLIGWIEKLNRKAFVGVHGAIFNKNVMSFHGNSESSIFKKFNFSEGVDSLKKVHLIGTGTLAFHSSLISSFKQEIFDLLNFRAGFENANDECLAVFAREKKIPMFVVPRADGWLPSNKKMKYGIYEDHFNDSNLSETVVELLSKGNPWPEL